VTVDPLEPFQRALADALASSPPEAHEVADAIGALLADVLRLTAAALGAVLDTAAPNSRTLVEHHRQSAESRIQALWLARGQLLETEPASSPVEKGEHPQVSSDEEQPRAETDTPDAVAYERAWHSGYVAGIEDRGRAEAAAAALGLDGPIVHQVETRSGPLGVSGAEAMASAAANAAVLKAAGEPTLFGQPVGDGLDDERADAKTAISILRLLLASGARLATLHGAIPGQVVLRPADAVIVTAEQADLLERLDRPVTGPLPHGGTSDAD
jgi:hypothetical protein